MRVFFFAVLVAFLGPTALQAQRILFQDDFKERLGPGWSWVREHREAWRLTQGGLEVRIEPGNMWGPQNDAKNLLVRPAPDCREREIEIEVTVANKPTNQYEQVDLVWCVNDSNMVKVGQELVDGSLSIVMGREEKDQCRTIAIVPLTSSTVHLRLLAKGTRLRGQFREEGTSEWRDVGECVMPVVPDTPAKLCLQFYQGPADAEHWARVTQFRIRENRGR